MSIFYHLRWMIAESLIHLALKIAANGKEKDDFMRFFVNHLRHSVAALEADLVPKGEGRDTEN